MSFSKIRLLLSALCALSVFLLPWWVPFMCAIALCLRYRAWEVVPIGIVFDLMWQSELSLSLTGLPLGTLTALALLALFEPLRRELLTGSALPR
jgi:hypothetical protein